MDEFKGKWSTAKQFEGIIKGNVDYNWYKKCENADISRNQNDSQIDNGKNISQDQADNIKIDNKDQIININIRTKIEDAWS